MERRAKVASREQILQVLSRMYNNVQITTRLLNRRLGHTIGANIIRKTYLRSGLHVFLMATSMLGTDIGDEIC